MAGKDKGGKGGKGGKGATKDAKKGGAASKAKKKEEKPLPIVLTPWQELCKNVGLLHKAAETEDDRLVKRCIRANTAIRKLMTAARLEKAAEAFLQNGPEKLHILENLPLVKAEEEAAGAAAAAAAAEEDVDMGSGDASTKATAADDSTGAGEGKDGDDEKEGKAKGKGKDSKDAAPTTRKVVVRVPDPSDLPEVTTYIHLLLLSQLSKYGKWSQVAASATLLCQSLRKLNKRTLDRLAARAFSTLSLAHEFLGTLSSIRPLLLAAHRTACLHHDDMGRATYVNLLLRNYLAYNLYDHAYKLTSKVHFPEAVSNNQLVRYLYYVGRIHAIQLNYSDAYACLTQAVRKAPTSTAIGFRQTVQKLVIIVQLLMGEVPDRAVFRDAELRGALVAHEALASAVRVGNLEQFNAALSKHKAQFQRERTHTLALRLRHNVIKAGLRKIALSYSNISFADIAAKLHLDSAIDAEFLCAKAIKDGVIDAVLDSESGALHSKDSVDVYATMEPQAAFHKRISFCLDVHNEAVRAMRYPPNAHKPAAAGKDDSGADEEEVDPEELAEALAEEEEGDGI